MALLRREDFALLSVTEHRQAQAREGRFEVDEAKGEMGRNRVTRRNYSVVLFAKA